MAWVFLAIASLGEIFGVASINMYLKEKNFRLDGYLSINL